MKSALVKFILLLLFLASPLLTVSQTAYAHCHSLNDPTGDAGSANSFADVVLTELSNEGDSIRVRVVTNGNIPNGFGTTGVMIFGVTFPASLLSGDPGDNGINIITVHWKEDGTGWEGSQFIYRGEVKSIPWNANITIDGKTASFKIPKSLIGKGTLAYQVNLGFLSEQDESNDSVPGRTGFSDCFVIPQEQAVSTPQMGGATEVKTTPQVISNGPTKEGNKIIEKPGVIRPKNVDVWQSVVAQKVPPSPTELGKQQQQSQNPKYPPQNLAGSNRPSGILVGLVAIFLIGTTIAAGAYFAIGSKLINDNCDRLRIEIEAMRRKIAGLKTRVKELVEKLKKAKHNLEKAKQKEADAVSALKRHLKGKRPSGDDYMDYENKRHYMKDYGYQTGKDVYDKKTKELEEKKAKAEEERAAAEKEAGEIELDLETNSFNLQQSEKTWESLEKELALCEKKLAEARREEAKRSTSGQVSRTVPPNDISSTDQNPDVDDKPSRACTPGEEEVVKRYQCEFLVLDEKGEITFKVDRALQETGKEAKAAGWTLKIISWLLALGSIGLTLVNFFFERGKMYAVFKAPVSLLGMTLGPAGDALITISKMPRKMRVTEATLPAKRVINVCKKVYVCKGGEWVPELRLEKSYTKPGEDVAFDLYDLRETLVEDLAKFLKEEAKRQFADPEKISREPCNNCRVKIELD